MFEKESLVGFFSSNLKVYGILVLLSAMSWFFAFKPTLTTHNEIELVEKQIVLALQAENDTKLYTESYPFVTSKDSLTYREGRLLSILNAHQKDFGFEILQIQPYTYNSKSGITSISTQISLKGSYFSFVKLTNRMKESPELGKVVSLNLYTREERSTKIRTLHCEMILQIITEL